MAAVPLAAPTAEAVHLAAPIVVAVPRVALAAPTVAVVAAAVAHQVAAVAAAAVAVHRAVEDIVDKDNPFSHFQ